MTNQWLSERVRQLCPRYQVITVDMSIQGNYTLRCLRAGYDRLRAINHSGCDVVFYPMPDPWFFQTPKIPQVSVIHDIAPGRYRWYQTRWMRPYQIRHCRKLIAISEYTKREALRVYPFLHPEGVEVIYNAVPYDGHSYAPLIEGRYVLNVNTLHPYKNADTLVRAFGLLRGHDDLLLVLVGRDIDGRVAALRSLAQNCADRLVHRFDLSDNELTALYQHATLFVTPSTIEGFGQTPIEAAMQECPVISSRETALPESTMELVDYYEPVDSPEALAAVMQRVLDHPVPAQRLNRIAQTFRQSYDVVGQSLKVYRCVCGVI
jgi:glycosyltransferase involved in cell wall biosynthesis